MKRLLTTIVFAMLSFGVASAHTAEAADNQNNETKSFEEVDVMPTFQGEGVEHFCYWVMTNVKYPKRAVKRGIEGMVLVSFVVYPDGKMRDYDVVKSPDKLLSDAVIDLLEEVNKSENGWKPAEVDGKPVKMSFTIPVNFIMQK